MELKRRKMTITQQTSRHNENVGNNLQHS